LLAQSLETTEEWITNSLRPQGLLGDEGNGYSYYTGAPSTHYTELIASFTFERCKARIVKETDSYAAGMFADKDGKTFPQFKSEYIETFSLSDIDPNSIVVNTEKPISVTLKTTNDRKLIHCSAITKNLDLEDYGKETRCIPETDSNEQSISVTVE
jgi:hypothetical protein